MLLLAEAFETAVDAVPLAEEIEDDASDGLYAALERCGGMQTVAHRNSKATRRWPCAALCMAWHGPHTDGSGEYHVGVASMGRLPKRSAFVRALDARR